jgi:hypothetical protein
MSEKPPRAPVVLKCADGRWATFGSDWTGRVDMQVFHPDDQLADGRPSWLAMNGYRSKYKPRLPRDLPEGQFLVQAFVASEGEDTIPMDQVTIRAADAPVVLMLPHGTYRIDMQDASGHSKTIATSVRL